jgi:subtilisin family serine protease
VGDYIGGVAPDAKLYAVKISTGNTGSASESAMIAGWEWCITHKNDDPNNPIMIISTSFGGGRYFSACDSASSGMTTAAANAVAAGITIFASSGNDGYCDSMGWPACISYVNSVGAVYDANFGAYYPCVNSASCAPKTAGGCSTGWYATDNTQPDKVTSYSNSASFLTLFAPSNQAYTTDIVGSGGYSTGDYTPSFGGTSAACPYAAGSAAVLQHAAKAQTGAYLTPAQVRTYLTSNGDNITDGKVAITKPRINLGRAVAALPSLESVIYVSKDASCNSHNPCVHTIQSGIAAASDHSIIEVTQAAYSENIVLNATETITLEGGWDAAFTESSTYTTVIGSITITHGTMIIEYVIVQ